MKRKDGLPRTLVVRGFVVCIGAATTLHPIEGPCLPCGARGTWRTGPILHICSNCEGRGVTDDAERIASEETIGLRVAEACRRCCKRSPEPTELLYAIIDLSEPHRRIAFESYLRAKATLKQLARDPVLTDRLFPPRNPSLFSNDHPTSKNAAQPGRVRRAAAQSRAVQTRPTPPIPQR